MLEPNSRSNTWIEWSNHVLKELERLHVSVKEIEKNVHTLNTDLKIVKSKNTMIIAGIAAIPSIILLIMQILPS